MSEACENTNPRAVLIDYTNWRGERSTRLVFPSSIRFGESPYHPGPQWLLDAWDVEKRAARTFAMKDIHRWGAETREDGPASPAGASGEVGTGEATEPRPDATAGVPGPPTVALGGLPGGTGGGGDLSARIAEVAAIIDDIIAADRLGDRRAVVSAVARLTPDDRPAAFAALAARTGVVVRAEEPAPDTGEVERLTAEVKSLRAERDAALVSLAESRAFADALMLELAEATGEDD